MNILYINFMGSGAHEDNTMRCLKEFKKEKKNPCLEGTKYIPHDCARCGITETAPSQHKKNEHSQGLWVCELCAPHMDNSQWDSGWINPLDLKHNVQYINIKGCANKDVGGRTRVPGIGVIARFAWPDLLPIISKVMSIINEDGVITSTQVGLEGIFGEALLCASNFNNDTAATRIGLIVLTGWSRGAVTAILLAKELGLASKTANIPVMLCADQPVPGNVGKIVNKYMTNALDLRGCANIKYFELLLADFDTRCNWGIIATVFQQILPQVSPITDRLITLMPVLHHATTGIPILLLRRFLLEGIKNCKFSLDTRSRIGGGYIHNDRLLQKGRMEHLKYSY